MNNNKSRLASVALMLLLLSAFVIGVTNSSDEVVIQPLESLNGLISPANFAWQNISQTYICDCDKTCPEISSCDEAYYQLIQCGCTIRDGNGNGIPCEELCGTPTPIPTNTPTPTSTATLTPINVSWIAPIGTVTNSYGRPEYRWQTVETSTAYELYVAPKDNIFSYRYWGTIEATQYCDGDTCAVNLADLAATAWLNNDIYWAFINPTPGATERWVGPFEFRIFEPVPDAVLARDTTHVVLPTPTINWSIPPNASYSAWYQIYIAPEQDVFNPTIVKWVSRLDACGGWVGFVCSYTTEVVLSDQTKYSFFIQSWGPGGLSQGGYLDTGWAMGTFVTDHLPVASSYIGRS